jgi:hypothetical protein
MRSSPADVLGLGRVTVFFSSRNVVSLSDSNFQEEVFVLLSFYTYMKQNSNKNKNKKQM